MGGQWLYYDQQRFYAGNNGVLGFINFSGAFSGSAFSDFLLGMAAARAVGVAIPTIPGRTSRADRPVRPGRLPGQPEPDGEPRPALGLHLAARREGQPAVELRPAGSVRETAPACRRSRRTAASTTARSTTRTTTAGSRASAWRGARPTASCCAAATASRSSWRAPAPTCGCRSTRRSSSSRTSTTTRRPGRERGAGFADLVPGTTPTGNVRAFDPDLRPQFTHQWNAFVEYQVTTSMSAQIGYVGHRANHLVAPSRATRRCPAWAIRRPGRQDHAASALPGPAAHHDGRDERLAARGASTTRSRRA
jgi:hypothetical protein